MFAEISQAMVLVCCPVFCCRGGLQALVVHLRIHRHSLLRQSLRERRDCLHAGAALVALPDLDFHPRVRPLPAGLLPANPQTGGLWASFPEGNRGGVNFEGASPVQEDSQDHKPPLPSIPSLVPRIDHGEPVHFGAHDHPFRCSREYLQSRGAFSNLSLSLAKTRFGINY